MKKRLLWIILLVVVCASVFAEDIQLSTYVVNIHDYDIAQGTYYIDFYMEMMCETRCNIKDIEFMNGRAAELDVLVDEPAYKQFRVFAELSDAVDLKDYPFDKQEIRIIVEDTLHRAEQVQLVPLLDRSGVDKNVNFPGWKINSWSAEVNGHYYPSYNEMYSRYTFTITLAREYLTSAIKNFLPVIFLILIIIFSYILSTDKIELRIGIVSSVLIAAVMLHITMLSHLPPTGYLTFADKFMVLTYFVLLVSFAINVAILRLSQLQKKSIIEKIHAETRYSMMIIIPLLYVLFFWLFL